MKKNKTKDRRINIRLDEDTYIAIKKIVQDDLKTDISSYCRSLLHVSALYEANISRIMNAVDQFRENKNIENLEYMIKIKNEIEFIGNFLTNIKENRKKYDDFITMIEKRYETLKNEARKYFSIYNEILSDWEKQCRTLYGEDYDTNPTIAKPWSKIDM